MKIIQTFWSGCGNPLSLAYGWTLPEYNLMSWTLSCLSLRRFYDEVELYTDRDGYEVLIEKLHLPYTRVHVVYDRQLCRPMYWAYAKIRTYAAQAEPFLHVDGDVYINQPFSDDVMNAPLVAQNREIGTVYYKRMIEDILRQPDLFLPADLMESISMDTVSSYNLGVFGGTDIGFIRAYCEKAIMFVVQNRLDDIETKPTCSFDCNILFEQVLFAVLADKANREVAGVIGRAIKDEGYTTSEFCDVCNFDSHHYFHILGGHKRNKMVLKGLSSLLYSRYMDYYHRILSLSSQYAITKECVGYCKYVPGRDADGILKYIDFLNNMRIFWNTSNCDCGAAIDESTSKSLFRRELDLYSKITRHPQLRLYKVSKEWTDTEKGLLRQRLHCEESFPVDHVAIIPFLHGRDCLETPLLREDMGILREIGDNAMTVKDVIGHALEKYEQEDAMTRNELVGYFKDELYRLLSLSVLVYV